MDEIKDIAEGMTPLDDAPIEGEFTPTEDSAVTMSFPDAIREIIRGKRVGRISWPQEDYGLLRDGWLTIYTNGAYHVWKVSDGDMEGNDWIIIK